MFNIFGNFGKVMFVAGVGLVFASAINAVKKEQEEAVVTIANEEEREEISFKEAAKRKVKKIYNKSILWAVDHIQDIQVWTMALGLFGAFLQVTAQLHDMRRTNQMMDKLNHLEERINYVAGAATANCYGINSIAYKTDAVNLPEEDLKMLYDKTCEILGLEF